MFINASKDAENMDNPDDNPSDASMSETNAGK